MSDSMQISSLFENADELNKKALEAFHQGAQDELKSCIDDAIAIYNQILELDPNNAKALYFLGNKYYESEEFQTSLSSYDKAIEILDKDDELIIDVQINRTGTLCELKRYDDAINDCNQILENYKTHEDFEDIQQACNWIINNCNERKKNN